MRSLPLVVVRLTGVLVTFLLATVGSWALGFGVLTACTSTTDACGTTRAVLGAGWVLQGVLLAVALSLWLPAVVRRLRRPVLVALAVAVPVVSAAAFAGTAWLADRSYCLGDGQRDYCDVVAGDSSASTSSASSATGRRPSSSTEAARRSSGSTVST